MQNETTIRYQFLPNIIKEKKKANVCKDIVTFKSKMA